MKVGQLIEILKQFPIGIEIGNEFDILYETEDERVTKIYFVDIFTNKLLKENEKLKLELEKREMKNKFDHERL